MEEREENADREIERAPIPEHGRGEWWLHGDRSLGRSRGVGVCN